jgi:hypothetical protein
VSAEERCFHDNLKAFTERVPIAIYTRNDMAATPPVPSSPPCPPPSSVRCQIPPLRSFDLSRTAAHTRV